MVNQPGDDRERDTCTGPDQNTLHGIADRKAEWESAKDADGEETASGPGGVLHGVPMARASRRAKTNMVNGALTMLVRSRSTVALLRATLWKRSSFRAASRSRTRLIS